MNEQALLGMMPPFIKDVKWSYGLIGVLPFNVIKNIAVAFIKRNEEPFGMRCTRNYPVIVGPGQIAIDVSVFIYIGDTVSLKSVDTVTFGQKITGCCPLRPYQLLTRVVEQEAGQITDGGGDEKSRSPAEYLL